MTSKSSTSLEWFLYHVITNVITSRKLKCHHYRLEHSKSALTLIQLVMTLTFNL